MEARGPSTPPRLPGTEDPEVPPPTPEEAIRNVQAGLGGVVQETIPLNP